MFLVRRGKELLDLPQLTVETVVFHISSEERQVRSEHRRWRLIVASTLRIYSVVSPTTKRFYKTYVLLYTCSVHLELCIHAFVSCLTQHSSLCMIM
jgi:hypothetical protein